MRFLKTRETLLAALLASLALAGQAAAQAPIEPQRLPARTYFYLVWRGTPSGAARQANSLLALWDDPDFAPVRAAFWEGLVSESGKDKSKPALTREEIEEYSTLLDNPFVLGYFGEAENRARKTAPDKAGAGADTPAWNGMFFVYDRTGKEALLAKAILRMRAQEKEPATVTTVMLGGISAVKVARKKETTYWGDTGKYSVSANEPKVFEEIVARLNQPAAGGHSLGEAAAYQEAKPILAKGNLVEFFLRVPNLKELVPAASPGQPDFRQALNALRLEAIHSLSGGVSLDGARMHLQGALLGEASGATLFDLWSSGMPVPATAALVPADAVSYTQGQLNLTGIYDMLHRALRSLSSNGQMGLLDMIEPAVQARIGMTIPEALALFTGEFASIQTSPDLDEAKRVFALGIQKKPETLKLLRTLLGERIASERNEGDTTFLKLSTHGDESGAGTVQWGTYQLAVTPNLLVGTPRLEVLRSILAQSRPGASAGSFTAQPKYLAARARFPEKLNGISFFDFERVDWEAAKARLLAASKKSSAPTAGAGAKAAPNSPAPVWLERLNPQVVARHLHSGASASWKDATGLKFDGWID